MDGGHFIRTDDGVHDVDVQPGLTEACDWLPTENPLRRRQKKLRYQESKPSQME